MQGAKLEPEGDDDMALATLAPLVSTNTRTWDHDEQEMEEDAVHGATLGPDDEEANQDPAMSAARSDSA